SALVSSRAAWRKQVAKWQEELREFNDLSEDSDGEGSARCSEAQTGRRQRRWLPISLDALFGSKITSLIRLRRQVFTKEILYMELLAAEHSDEEPDDGEKDGSGDDF
ncbi:hypothetical protein C8R45DRAFT_757874, partial [Mycena sanguinolenta]